MPSTKDTHVAAFEPLVSPAELEREWPAPATVQAHVLESREAIRRVLHGEDPRLLMVVGPCSIHDEVAALEYAQRLAALAEELADRLVVVMRVYFEKPRTTIGWKGLINDPHLDGTLDIATGLRRARELLLRINALGLAAGTEFLDPIVPQYIADLISWVAIGARTTESQTHREMASGLSMPVGFKNGTNGDHQIAIDAMLAARSPHAFLGIGREGRTTIVKTTGNPDGHLILRGGKQGPNYDARTIADAAERLSAAGLPPRIMVDCSHANANKDYTRQAIAFRDVVAQRVAGNARIVGLMLESNLQAGNQKLPANPADLAYGVSITDPCVDWNETDTLLREAHAATTQAGSPVAQAGG